MEEHTQINYADEAFISITSANRDGILFSISRDIIIDNFYGDEGIISSAADEDSGEMLDANLDNCINVLFEFLQKFEAPYTIVQEDHHIDASFRDTFYHYYSNQHFKTRRYSRRLSFFNGIISREQFFSEDSEIDNDVKKRFMGSCVINPLLSGVLGRTLIDPIYIMDKEKKFPVYMRLSEFLINVYGKQLKVRAFPYRMQDEETMRCAEVTMLNLIEYYSNSYKDYKSVVPSEILDKEQLHSHERVLPSSGTTYPIFTKVLADFGFSPRLYNLSSFATNLLSRISPSDEIKRILHYYIESGIPVAVNLQPINSRGSGHSLLCVGHGQSTEKMKKRAAENKWISWANRENGHALINSADFYSEYIVIDDNEAVYQIRDFDNLSMYPDMKVSNLAVPLYKRMFLDAPDAAAIITSVLNDSVYGIENWSGDFLRKQEDVIIRIFMASSRSFKRYRISKAKNIDTRVFYSQIAMPRFIWVCELFRLEDYDNLQAFGEVVVDATSAMRSGANNRSLIMMRYPNIITFREPEQSGTLFEQQFEIDEGILFEGYRDNLDQINV